MITAMADTDVTTLLAGIVVTALTVVGGAMGTFAWFLKALFRRSEEMRKLRDQQIAKLIEQHSRALKSLQEAISKLAGFEISEEEAHTRIFSGQDKIINSQSEHTRILSEMTALIEKIHEKLGRLLEANGIKL